MLPRTFSQGQEHDSEQTREEKQYTPNRSQPKVVKKDSVKQGSRQAPRLVCRSLESIRTALKKQT